MKMKIILKGLLRAIGVRRVLLAVVDLGYAELKKLADKTDTPFDNLALESLLQILKDIAGAENVSAHVAQMKSENLKSYVG